MNERILELADKAGADIWDDQASAGSHFNIEKFAELIIQECLVAINNTNLHHAHTSFDYNLVTATVTKSKKAVQEHFGVEE